MRFPFYASPAKLNLFPRPMHLRLQTYIEKAESLEAAAVELDEWTKYCEDTSATKRRPSRTVWAGKVPIGSEHRIARQTMTTTNTNDVDATVAQARGIQAASSPDFFC